MTVVAVGHLVHDALAVAEELAEDVSVEVFDPRTLYPFDWELLDESLARTGRLVVFDDANRSCGFAAEVVATAAEEMSLVASPATRDARRRADLVRGRARARGASEPRAACSRRSCRREGGGAPVIDVQIPKMGMSTVEVDIVAVNVAPGDRVESDSIVVEVQSEKANFEIEAGTAGIVKEVLVQEGDEAKVGDVVVRLES